MSHPFIAVHAGAGYHSDSNSKELKTLCKTACTKAMAMLKQGCSASEATAVAVSVLESSLLTNAGRGSNLTLTGSVECDASVMDGSGGFGAVGAVQGLTNPVNVALKLLQENSQGCLSLGRVPPVLLVSSGAQQWARHHGFSVCDPDDLITDRAREVYLDHKSRLDGAVGSSVHHHHQNRVHYLSPSSLDTVGAICVDARGGVSGGVSSGGISLKFPGRVGQAAAFGCGCWADENPTPHSKAIACSSSGTGEYIVLTMLARECALSMLDSSLHKALEEKFINSKCLSNVEQKLAGVIALNLTTDATIHFSWGHTTESMCIGHMSSCKDKPTAFISKLDFPEKIGKTAQVEAIRLSPPRTTHGAMS